MIKYCLNKWNMNNGLLKEKLMKDPTLNSCEYDYLVKLVVDFVLNPEEKAKWDSSKITVIDNGDYQGTLLFLIPRDTYQPAEYEYLITYVGYGSCSGCDTLMSIQNWSEGCLTNGQVKCFMNLCKDILTNMVKPYNCGWRGEEEFTEVKLNEGGKNG